MVSASGTMAEASAREILGKLDRLRAELVELAYTLDVRGHLEAADVAITTAARIGELCEGCSGRSPPALRRQL